VGEKKTFNGVNCSIFLKKARGQRSWIRRINDYDWEHTADNKYRPA